MGNGKALPHIFGLLFPPLLSFSLSFHFGKEDENDREREGEEKERKSDREGGGGGGVAVFSRHTAFYHSTPYFLGLFSFLIYF